ncbi:MAG: RNA polymerase sigma factor [Polyangiaceae bacterium]|nr:RNA polymerase sigma factor [Polyangiaceae bacterium]
MDGEQIELTLELLMEQYTQGSAEAFDELYRRSSARVFGYLLRLTRHRERAEDLLQVTYSKLHRARDSYITGAPFMPWVFAIARRSFLDERRRASSRNEDLSDDGTLPEPSAGETNGLPTDTVAALERAMNRLPSAYREAIELTKVSGLSIAEAAEVLGATPQAVKLRVHRGYALLRKSLDSFSRGAP